MKKDEIRVVAQNKKAWYNYYIKKVPEAGIVLSGTEVKSIRQGKVNLKDSYASIVAGEDLYFAECVFSPYEQGNIFNKDALRDRKLLLHRYEINKLLGYIQQKGLTIIPVKVYFSKNRVKLELGVAKGKKLFDKRDDIAKKDAKREIDRALKEEQRY